MRKKVGAGHGRKFEESEKLAIGGTEWKREKHGSEYYGSQVYERLNKSK